MINHVPADHNARVDRPQPLLDRLRGHDALLPRPRISERAQATLARITSAVRWSGGSGGRYIVFPLDT